MAESYQKLCHTESTGPLSRAQASGEIDMSQLVWTATQATTPKSLSRTVVRLPDCNVLVVKGFLRSSYTNVLLIASRSRLKRVPYYKSARQMAFNETHATPFPMCAQLPVHFGGANAHCKCAERDARCSVRDQMYAGVE
ncbi:hypothetical protein PG988_012845 [Apiospora saccharicola]